MKPPIVITEDWDISVHPSVIHAEAFHEIVDVREGIYSAYDSEGYLLELTVVLLKKECHFLFFNWSTSHESVIIRESNPSLNCASVLREKLLNYLNLRGISEEKLHGSSLIDLIGMVSKYMPWSMSEALAIRRKKQDYGNCCRYRR